MIKHIMIFQFLLILTFFSMAQQGEIESKKTGSITLSKNKTNYLRNYHPKVMYPDLAIDNAIEGDVFLSYFVDSTCKIINRQVVKGIGYGCDEECLKTLQDMEYRLRKINKCKCDTATIYYRVSFILNNND